MQRWAATCSEDGLYEARATSTNVRCIGISLRWPLNTRDSKTVESVPHPSPKVCRTHQKRRHAFTLFMQDKVL